MKIKKFNWFVKLITFNWPAAITLAPFGVYIKEKYIEYPVLIQHESIHWKQQMEMLIVPFYIWYLLEWLIRLPVYGKEAYRNLSFEREAKTFEGVQGYLGIRSRYAWLKFIFHGGRN